MRILWHSNAPWCGSGYGVQTSLMTQALQAHGHDIAISCQFGLDDGVLYHSGPRESIPCLPKGKLALHGMLPAHAERWEADVIIPHYDLWTFNDEALFGGRVWAPWFPVDTEDLAPPVKSVAEHASLAIVQSRSAEAAMERAGLKCEYVPAAFNGADYKFHDREAFRGEMQDRFIVGVVAANRSMTHSIIRKAFPQIIEGFAMFRKERPDAFLHFHSRVGGEEGGINLPELLAHYGVPREAYGFADQYLIDCGMPAEMMSGAYSAFDCLLLPSMGEGFGVPIVEAQACGTPVVVGGWTAMEELCYSGHAIPKQDAYKYHIPAYGDQWLARPESVRDGLLDVAAQSWDRDAVAAKVADYEIQNVAQKYWPPVLEKLERIVGKPRPHPDGNRAARRAARRVKMADQVAA